MSEYLTIVAKITAKPGAEGRLESELRKLVSPTRSEDGCVQYDLHRSLEDPRVFLFFENWSSAPHLEAHMNTDHLLAFQRKAGDLVDEMELLRMERID
jgi:quinol monooxygenase YgiN